MHGPAWSFMMLQKPCSVLLLVLHEDSAVGRSAVLFAPVTPPNSAPITPMNAAESFESPLTSDASVLRSHFEFAMAGYRSKRLALTRVRKPQSRQLHHVLGQEAVAELFFADRFVVCHRCLFSEQALVDFLITQPSKLVRRQTPRHRTHDQSRCQHNGKPCAPNEHG